MFVSITAQRVNVVIVAAHDSVNTINGKQAVWNAEGPHSVSMASRNMHVNHVVVMESVNTALTKQHVVSVAVHKFVYTIKYAINVVTVMEVCIVHTANIRNSVKNATEVDSVNMGK